jgi:hypothetical protein
MKAIAFDSLRLSPPDLICLRMHRLPVWQESMKKNQQDVEVLKPELEHLDWDVGPQQAINEFKSFGVYRECANPECETEFQALQVLLCSANAESIGWF